MTRCSQKFISTIADKIVFFTNCKLVFYETINISNYGSVMTVSCLTEKVYNLFDIGVNQQQ